MPKKKTKKEYTPQQPSNQAPRCAAAGCKEAGEYRAPKSKDNINEYNWYCLEHIREVNKKWDFFAGMNADQIEEFRREAVTGHRPTWNRETRIGGRQAKLEDALYEFLHPGGKKPKPSSPAIPPKIRKALSLFDMEYPFTVKHLKGQYRILVKKYHPDVNKHDKNAEETFKRITDAYRVLCEHVKNL